MLAGWWFLLLPDPAFFANVNALLHLFSMHLLSTSFAEKWNFNVSCRLSAAASSCCSSFAFRNHYDDLSDIRECSGFWHRVARDFPAQHSMQFQHLFQSQT